MGDYSSLFIMKIAYDVKLFVCVLSHFSHVRLFATLWTVTRQPHLSMEFSRQEYWSGLPCPPPEDLPHSGIEPVSPAASTWQVDSLQLNQWGSPQCNSDLYKMGQSLFLNKLCKISKVQEVTNGNKSCKAFLKKKRKLKCSLLESVSITCYCDNAK